MVKTTAVFIVAMLRLASAAAAFAAAIVMVTSHDSATYFNVTLDARFQYTPAFKFLVAVNAAVSAYSIIVLFIFPGSKVSPAIVTMDMLSAMLLTSSLSAAGVVGYIGKKGNERAGWLPVCDQVPKFCDQAMWSLVCNFAGSLLYTVIAFHGGCAAADTVSL